MPAPEGFQASQRKRQPQKGSATAIQSLLSDRKHPLQHLASGDHLAGEIQVGYRNGQI